MLHAIVHAADIQDRDGGAMLMATLFGLFPFLLKLYADGGYQGPEFRKAIGSIMAQIDVEIVKRSDRAKGFVVLPKRWMNLPLVAPIPEKVLAEVVVYILGEKASFVIFT